MSTGEKLRAWRDRVGLSQQKAAEKVGTVQPAWRQWECGSRSPDIDFAAAIERVTDGEITMQDWARERRVQRARAREAKALAVVEESGTDVLEAARAAS